MRKSLWIIPVLLVVTGAPIASAESIVLPCITTTPGGPLTLGSGVFLSDSATLAGCGDVYPGTLTFGLTGPPGFLGGGPSLVTVQAPGDGTFNIGKGVPPTVPGTYVWVVIFTAKDGSSVSSPTETQVVTPEPGAGALLLAGIGFLLVSWKRCASGRTPTSWAHRSLLHTGHPLSTERIAKMRSWISTVAH